MNNQPEADSADEGLKPCPMCGHHAYPPTVHNGEWEIQCSSSHCRARVTMIADGWTQQLDAKLNPHIPANELYDDRRLKLIRIWNRRATPAPVPSAEELSAEEIDEIFNVYRIKRQAYSQDHLQPFRLAVKEVMAKRAVPAVDKPVATVRVGPHDHGPFVFEETPHGCDTLADGEHQLFLHPAAPAGGTVAVPVAWISPKLLDWLKICRESERGAKGGAEVEAVQSEIFNRPLYASPIGAGERETIERDAAIGQLVRQKMTSGNSVSVERCTITADEISALSATGGAK